MRVMRTEGERETTGPAGSPVLAGVPFPLLLAALTAIYFVAGKLGLELAFVHANATAVWPPTGLALAAMILLGFRVWPAILVGAFLVNITTAGSVATSIGIATGNTLEAVVGAWLLRRIAGGVAAFHRPHGVFQFAVVVMASTTVSATIGVLSLWSGGYAEPVNLPDIWLTWWLGDAVGAMVFAPLIILWVMPAERRLPRRSWLEVVALTLAIVGAGWAVFGHNAPLSFLSLPPLIWAALRFGRRGAATAAVALSAIALWGTLHGYGAFASDSPNESLMFLQAFVGVATLTALVLAANVRERERVEDALRRARGELEGKVEERTASLREAVTQLQDSRLVLSEAQRVAHIGSWEWDVAPNRVSWSDELYRIYGLESQTAELDYESFLASVHPDDRERVDTAVRASFESGEPFELQHRIVRPDGAVRTLFASGRVVRENGSTVGMLGTGQDVTERVAAEAALRESERRFRVLAENASDVISFSTAGGQSNYISPAVRVVLGYEPEELVGQQRMDLVHPDDLPALEAIRSGLDADKESVTATFRVRHKAGHYVWVESVVTTTRSPSGEVEGTVTITRDVTEWIERSRFRDLLQQVTRVANEAVSADTALGGALAVICRFKDWPLAHVYVAADDGSGDLVPTGIWYPEEPAGHDEFRRVTAETRFRRGVGLPGRVMESGLPAWIPNVMLDPNFPRAQQVKEIGLGAAFGFPVGVGEEPLAVLEFFTTEVLAPEERFLAILDQIGTQLGEVLRRQQAEETLRNREAQLAQAQTMAQLGSWDWDVQRNRITWSDELFRIHGREPGSMEVGYDDVVSHIHPDDRERIDGQVRSALARGGDFEYEYRLVQPDGATRIVHTQGRVVKDVHGRPVHMQGVCQDITGRREAEEALRSSEQRYRFLADYSTDMILSITPEGVCTYASPAARALLGFAPEELVGRPVGDLVHPDDVQTVSDTRQAILKSFASRSVTCRLRRKSGGWVWAETTSRGVRDPATGRVESIVAVTRNVSDRVRAEETIRLAQQVTAIANEATTVDSAMKQALEVISRYTGWPIGHVYVPSGTFQSELTSSDIWHIADPARFSDFRQLSETTPVAVGQGLPGLVLASGKAKWITDIGSDPQFIRRPAAKALGLQSAFAFPIKAVDETLAVLEFFSTDREPLGEDVLSLMESVSTQLGEVVRRQRIEVALKGSEVRFRAVAETANDAIVTIDDESRIVYCNPAASTIFGLDDLVGRPLTTIMPERFREQHLAGLAHYMRTNEGPILGKRLELVGLHASGHEFPIELSISDWRTDEGQFFTGIVRDVTARKEAEAALTEKVEELAQSNAELALFSYVASHDLREPLRTVASNVQLLERGMGEQLTPGARKSIRFALEGVHRMQALINDLLAYSRVGTEAGVVQPVDAEVVLDEVLAGLKATIDSEGAVVTRGPMPQVWADRVQLGQVLQNLLSNALKFHDEGSPRVHVSAARDESEWVFSVGDEGIGFDPAFVEHVFTIFQRLHSPEEYPGTGIGLAICRKIIQRHGGRIWADTELGKGTVFHFTIPIRD